MSDEAIEEPRSCVACRGENGQHRRGCIVGDAETMNKIAKKAFKPLLGMQKGFTLPDLTKAFPMPDLTKSIKRIEDLAKPALEAKDLLPQFESPRRIASGLNEELWDSLNKAREAELRREAEQHEFLRLQTELLGEVRGALEAVRDELGNIHQGQQDAEGKADQDRTWTRRSTKWLIWIAVVGLVIAGLGLWAQLARDDSADSDPAPSSSVSVPTLEGSRPAEQREPSASARSVDRVG